MHYFFHKVLTIFFRSAIIKSSKERKIKDRKAREQIIKMIGNGKPIASFIVDKGHRNGPEIHEITDTAIINIYNQRTHKLITKLIARPGQIRRYYTNGNAPQEILDKAYKNMKNHYNK